MIEVYIAGKYTAKWRLALERSRVNSLGYHVSSSWMDQPEVGYVFNGATPEEQEERKLAEAYRDINEVKGCDMLILDTQDESATGGREVEWGMALNSGWKILVLVGPERNIFHAYADAKFKDWNECCIWLAKVKNELPGEGWRHLNDVVRS